MSRFAPISSNHHLELSSDYTQGFSSPVDSYTFIAKPGLTRQLIEVISSQKNEPSWMLQYRLKAYERYLQLSLPPWGGDLSTIDFDSIHYYLKATKNEKKSWTDVPQDIKDTFDKLGIPQAERAVLAGVKAQFDSEVIYGSIKKMLSDQGVVFISMDEAVQQYPDIVKAYFGKLIPSGDNKFAALNTAVWSGGSYVYVPKGVEVKLPLQAYFRLNAPSAGQFERTLIIADEGSKVHYVEGCFVAGTTISTDHGRVFIEDVEVGDQVITHQGNFEKVYHTQKRQYSGKLYELTITGQPFIKINVTEEHPLLVVKRQLKNERNFSWKTEWQPVKHLQKNDYVCLPVNQLESKNALTCQILEGHSSGSYRLVDVSIPQSPDLFRLFGYYLAEGSISSGYYLNFSFSSKEREYIEDVKQLLIKVFNENHFHESNYEKNHGTSVVVRSVKLCRIFQYFLGHGARGKYISTPILQASKEVQAELIKGWFRGDGNYYRKQRSYGLKEMFRISTVSPDLAENGRMVLARLGIASSLNVRPRHHEHRQDMYNLIIGGEYLTKFGSLVGVIINPKLNHKKRATLFHVDDNFLYQPIKTIKYDLVKNLPVFNFSVNQAESYVANGIAAHNCTAPAYSSESLHSAVVEIYVKKGARVQYTTVQNWYKTVYNLVTKRAHVAEEGEMIWTDFNMGSKLTMKYPSFILAGKGARGETLSMALAGEGQHQDTGSKAIHLAPYTTSTIVSKSISKAGGRTSYRGLVSLGPKAHHSKSRVVCDALILDPQSRSDTYPRNLIFNHDVTLEHEASVSKISEDQLFYLMSRGLSEEAASKMIVSGFVAPLVKKLPLEYAVEMNRLIDLEMEGSVG